MSRNTKQRPLTAFFTKPSINESPPRFKKEIDENTSPCIFSGYDKMVCVYSFDAGLLLMLYFSLRDQIKNQ